MFYILHIFCVHHCKLPSPELPEEEISIWIQRGLKFLLQVFSVPNFAGSVPTMSIRSKRYPARPISYPWHLAVTWSHHSRHQPSLLQCQSTSFTADPTTTHVLYYTIYLLSIYNHLKAFQDLGTISWKGSKMFQNMCLHLPAITRSISVTRPGWQVSVFCSRLKLPPSGLDPTTVTEQCHPFHQRRRQKRQIWLNLDISELSSLDHIQIIRISSKNRQQDHFQPKMKGNMLLSAIFEYLKYWNIGFDLHAKLHPPKT